MTGVTLGGDAPVAGGEACGALGFTRSRMAPPTTPTPPTTNPTVERVPIE
jgi:hypothetical protein